MSKQKNKGSGFEREVAKFLVEVYNDSFTRVPYSGAYVGGINTKRKKHLSENQVMSYKGDITPPDTWKNFHCETKFYKEFLFYQLFLNDCPLLDQWLEQIKNAENPNDINLLFIKINYKGRWVCVQQKYDFQFSNSVEYKDWRFGSWENFWSVNHNIELIKYYSTKIY